VISNFWGDVILASIGEQKNNESSLDSHIPTPDVAPNWDKFSRNDLENRKADKFVSTRVSNFDRLERPGSRTSFARSVERIRGGNGQRTWLRFEGSIFYYNFIFQMLFLKLYLSDFIYTLSIKVLIFILSLIFQFFIWSFNLSLVKRLTYCTNMLSLILWLQLFMI
jgi:hypothetical protein